MTVNQERVMLLVTELRRKGADGTPDGRTVTASTWNDYGMPGSLPEKDFTAIADAFERTYVHPGRGETSGE